jgi:hypothetical protein
MHRLRLLVLLGVLLALPFQAISAVAGCNCPSSHGHAAHMDDGAPAPDHGAHHHGGIDSHPASSVSGTCCCTPAAAAARVFPQLTELSFSTPTAQPPASLPALSTDSLYRPPLAA